MKMFKKTLIELKENHMYRINRLKKSIASMAIVMGCVLATSFSIGAVPANKTQTATPTTNTAPQKSASADNSLKGLKLSEGTLSPKFVYNTVQYTATVDENTTSIDVNATASDSSATVQSITGNKELKEGANTVKVVVKAGNGNLATYTIVVTRGGNKAAANDSKPGDTKADDSNKAPDASSDTAQGDAPATVSGADGYKVSDNIPQSVIPADFTKTDVTYQNAATKGLKFDKGDLVLLYMLDANSKGQLFVYDQTAGSVYPFAKITSGDRYIIPLQTPTGETVDSSYTAADLTVADKKVTGAYQNGSSDTADFYLMYAMNSDGKGGWYQYDKAEGTYQRYTASSTGDVTSSDQYKYLQKTYSELNDKYNSLKDKDTKFIAGLIIALAIFLIIIVNLLLRGGKGTDEEEERKPAKSKGDVFGSESKTSRNNKKIKEEPVKDRQPQQEFDDKDEDAFADFEEEPDLLSRRKPKKEKQRKSRNSDVFESKKAKKDEDYYDDEEPLEEKKKSSSLDDDLEILDLNDL
jgi:hypothetical protein